MTPKSDRVRELGQFPTPVWVAESLVERHFPRLDRHDLVVAARTARMRFSGHCGDEKRLIRQAR